MFTRYNYFLILLSSNFYTRIKSEMTPSWHWHSIMYFSLHSPLHPVSYFLMLLCCFFYKMMPVLWSSKTIKMEIYNVYPYICKHTKTYIHILYIRQDCFAKAREWHSLVGESLGGNASYKKPVTKGKLWPIFMKFKDRQHWSVEKEARKVVLLSGGMGVPRTFWGPGKSCILSWAGYTCL